MKPKSISDPPDVPSIREKCECNFASEFHIEFVFLTASCP